MEQFGLVVLILLILLVNTAASKAISGETVGEFATRVPLDFYRSVRERARLADKYDQKNENYCILYSSAYATRSDPLVLRAAMEKLSPGLDIAPMDIVVAMLAGQGWNLESVNFLIKDGRWNSEMRYADWLARTRNWVASHLPAMLYPRVPGALYHAVIVTRWSRGSVTFFDPNGAFIYDLDETSFSRAIIGSNLADGGWLSHYVYARRRP